jgi:hypothetical protein
MPILTPAMQVTLRWSAALTPQSVTGIVVLQVQKNTDKKSSQKWLIQNVYSEFNSGKFDVVPCRFFARLTRRNTGAWLVDLGVFTPTTCSAAKRDVFTLA